jgi:uncharacterized protein YjbJ (UPF0337 family)
LNVKEKEINMDEDRIKGSAQKIKGDLKDAAGKALGDQKLHQREKPIRPRAK